MAGWFELPRGDFAHCNQSANATDDDDTLNGSNMLSSVSATLKKQVRRKLSVGRRTMKPSGVSLC